MVPMIWTSWSSSGSLTLSGLMPDDDRDGAVGQDLDDREGVAAEADHEVDRVADVEQVADARELVDRGSSTRGGPVGTRERTARFWKSVRVDLAAREDGRAGGLADRLRRDRRSTFPSTRFTASVLRREHVGRHDVPSGMSTAAARTVDGARAARSAVALRRHRGRCPPRSTTTNTNAARKMPSSRTSRLVRRTN